MMAHQRKRLAPDSQLADTKRELMNLLDRLTFASDSARRDQLRAEASRIVERIRQYSPRATEDRVFGE